jgi:large subunit ribosomal protein L29
MKQNDIQALHEKSVAELNAQLTELESELGKSKVEHSVGKLQSPSSLRMLRKSIARIKSILREKELSI